MERGVTEGELKQTGRNNHMAADMDAGTQLVLFSTDNPTMEEALRVFCDVYMPACQFAATTRRGYRYDLREWFAHVPVRSVKSISTLSMHRYVSHLDSKGLQDSTRKRKVAALATFLRFLVEQGVLPDTFSSSLVWPKVEQAEPRPLSPGQYTVILREAASNPRDRAMFVTLLQTGIRLSELTAITVESITLPAEPSVDPITGYGLLRVRRKAGRVSELVVNYKAARAIQTYLVVRPHSPTQALFLNKYGKPLSNRTVEKALKKYARAAGISWAHVHTSIFSSMP
jgi:site-specific recombinase XerD